MTLKLAFILEAVDKATAPLRGISRAVDRISEPFRRLNGISMQTAFRFGRMMGNRLREQFGEATDRLGRLRDTTRDVAQSFGAVTLAAGGVFFALKRTVDTVDQAVDVSKKLGISVQQYQRLGVAAQLNGSSQEEMGGALQFLAQNMVEAINGSKEATTWFARVGIPLERLKKMNVVDVFEAISDKFLQVGDAGQNAEKKIAVMRALMGRGGAELKQVLDQGSAGLRKFYEEADRLGAVVDDTTADSMADFNDNFDRLKFSIFGVMAAITKTALPTLDALVQRLTRLNVDSRGEWGRNVGEAIANVAAGLPSFLQALGQILGALAGIARGANVVAQALGGWQTVIAVITGLILGKLVVAIYSAGAAIVAIVPTIWSLGAALMATPLGWFLAAIAAIVGLAVLIVKNWEPISAFFRQLWDGIKGTFSSAYDWIAGKVEALLGMASKVASVVSGLLPGGGEDPSGGEFDALGNRIGGSTAGSALAEGAGARRTEVGGTLKIQIDQEGRARVKEVKSASSNMDIDVYSGMSMAGA